MLFKILKAYLCLICCFMTTTTHADSYRLVIDNNTNDHFKVNSSSINNSMRDLDEGSKGVFYDVEWTTNSTGTTAFVLQFLAQNKGYSEVIVTGLQGVDEQRQLQCWSQAYRCQVLMHNIQEGQLLINFK